MEATVNIWILEFEERGDENPEVEFFGNVERVPEQKQTLEQEGIPEHFEVEAQWDESLYTEEENNVIATYIYEAEEELIRLAKKERDECDNFLDDIL